MDERLAGLHEAARIAAMVGAELMGGLKQRPDSLSGVAFEIMRTINERIRELGGKGYGE